MKKAMNRKKFDHDRDASFDIREAGTRLEEDLLGETSVMRIFGPSYYLRSSYV